LNLDELDWDSLLFFCGPPSCFVAGLAECLGLRNGPPTIGPKLKTLLFYIFPEKRPISIFAWNLVPRPLW
jgi:hypothetical protein